jgi:hypothetical protein
MKKKLSKVHWILDAEALAQLRGCKDCKSEPVVFLTVKKVPCCKLHWEKLVDDVDVASVDLAVPKVEEWVDFEETTAKYPLSDCCNIKAPKNEKAV